MHILQASTPGFGAKTTGEAQGLVDGLITPFANSVSISVLSNSLRCGGAQ